MADHTPNILIPLTKEKIMRYWLVMGMLLIAAWPMTTVWADAEGAAPAAREQEESSEKVDKQMERAEDKHRRRYARLERLRNLLIEAGNDEAVARVDRAIRKENARYAREMSRLRHRDRDAANRFDKTMKQVKQREREQAQPKDEAKDANTDDDAGQGSGSVEGADTGADDGADDGPAGGGGQDQGTGNSGRVLY
jgi:hypothetical protein